MNLTAGQFALKVAYREANKQYGSTGGEVDSGLTPFDEVEVAAGESFELPQDSRLIFVRELTPVVATDISVEAGA